MTKPLALIIEDDPKLTQVFALSIQEHFETETFTDGDSALARLAHVTPRIVPSSVPHPARHDSSL